MDPASDPHLEGVADIEQALRNRVIDTLLILSAVAGTLTIVLTQIRALSMGWSVRDLFQISALGVIIFLTLTRRKRSLHVKAVTLVLAYLAAATAGLLTLGMLAGSVFLFPITALIVALVYSRRITVAYLVFIVLLFGVVALLFHRGILTLPEGAGMLTADLLHWAVYTMCVGFFYAVTWLTVLDYRRALDLLVTRVTAQRDELRISNQELREAMTKVKKLSGLLPICASCKKIRDDTGYWNKLESYIMSHSEADFSHGICPDCMERLYPRQSRSIFSPK